MLKYNDKVIVINDEDNDGFYVGFEGVVKHYTADKSLGTIMADMVGQKPRQMYYGVYGEGETLFFKEDQLQKI